MSLPTVFKCFCRLGVGAVKLGDQVFLHGLSQWRAEFGELHMPSRVALGDGCMRHFESVHLLYERINKSCKAPATMPVVQFDPEIAQPQ
ncbi:MAG TPA: hypothetical protein VGM81_15475 [Burkholderiaceae bacterium]